MKAIGIKSDVRVDGSVMHYGLTDVATGAKDSIAVALDSIFPGFDDLPNLAQRALTFAVRTRLRNETAGAEFKDAANNIREAVEDFLNGTWIAARATSGEARSGLLIQAIVIASKGKYDAQSAQSLINDLVNRTAVAQKIDVEDDSDATASALRKVRSAVRKAFLEQKPSVAAALAKLQSDAAAAKADRAEAAAAGVESDF